MLQGLLRDPELVYAQEAFAWTRRDDVGPRAVQIVIKDAAADDVAVARASYAETQDAIGAGPATWKKGS